jgi:hypothetical protein
MERLNYILKIKGEYIIREMTPQKLYALTRGDRTLSKRLDHHPFRTRAEAEKRREELTAPRDMKL